MDVQSNWLPIEGYSGYYEVSDHGVIRGLERRVKLPNGKTRQVRGKIISPKQNSDGYIFVTLSKEGITQTKYVHVLVAQAYIPNPDNLKEVNHKSGVKSDNSVENLEWVTHSENMIHAYNTGLCTNNGGNHSFAVGVIDNTLGKEFGTIREWCAARGINYSTGRNVLNGCNTSKLINLSEIILIKKQTENVYGK